MTADTPSEKLTENEKIVDDAQYEPLLEVNVDNAEIAQPADADANAAAAGAATEGDL